MKDSLNFTVLYVIIIIITITIISYGPGILGKETMTSVQQASLNLKPPAQEAKQLVKD